MALLLLGRFLRIWGVVWLVASLVFTGLNWYAEARLTENLRKLKQRYEEQQKHGTNQMQLRSTHV